MTTTPGTDCWMIIPTGSGTADERPPAGEARAWVQAHLPPADLAHVMHGDLLPQNFVACGKLI